MKDMDTIRKYWPMILTIVTIIVFSVRLEGKINSLYKAFAKHEVRFEKHESIPAHTHQSQETALMREQIRSVTKRVDSVQAEQQARTRNVAAVQVLEAKIENLDAMVREVRADLKEVLKRGAHNHPDG